MRGGRFGVGRPVVAAPVDRVRGRLAGQPLPPDVAVVGLGAVGEDRVARDRVDRVGVGDRARCPGATPKKPASGLTAYSRPSWPNFIHAMSSPIVSTFQSGSVGISIARLVLPHALGNAAVDVLDLALGRGQLQDQHVLGQPALVARHHRGDPQREALLAEQRVAAVARAVRPDLARLGEVDDVLVVRVARPRDVLRAVGQRHPDRVQAGHEVAVVAEHVERRLAHPGHDPHRARRRRPSRSAARRCRRSATRAGPSRTAPRTSCGRASSPRTARSARRASPRARASCWSGRRPPRCAEQMNVRSSTRATSSGSDSARYEFGRLASDSRSNVPASTSVSASRSYSSADPSHQWTSSGCVSAAISSTHACRRA